MQRNKVMIIAPHMDDEVLGCGGVICRHKNNKDKVWVIFVANRVYNHIYNEAKNEIQKKHALVAKKVIKYDEAIFLNLPDERLDATVQEIIIPLEKYICKIKPQIVYIPFRGDNNQDHRAVFDAMRVVVRPSAAVFINNIYMYEVPSSTEQSPPLLENAFLPNHFVNITAFIDRKIKAIKQYETEQRRFPHPRSWQTVELLAKKRGSEAGFNFAEAFMVLKSMWT